MAKFQHFSLAATAKSPRAHACARLLIILYTAEKLIAKIFTYSTMGMEKKFQPFVDVRCVPSFDVPMCRVFQASMCRVFHAWMCGVFQASMCSGFTTSMCRVFPSIDLRDSALLHRPIAPYHLLLFVLLLPRSRFPTRVFSIWSCLKVYKSCTIRSREMLKIK